ncbi:MAG: alpha/beta fold hydrolase [Pseudomonadota bacterium]
MPETLLNVFFPTLLVVGGFVAICYFWEWFYQAPTSQDETGYFVTGDGWRLAVHRYRPQGAAKGLPVILCHGLGGNRYSFDLHGAPSLAPYLKKSGRDVWVLELRGSGASDRPGFWIANVPCSWGFGDHLECDVPAAINYVLERTGAPAVHWIGHSMGGMLAEAWLARSGNPGTASVTVIGSPADFSKINRPAFHMLLHLRWALRLLHIAPVAFFAKAFIPVIHRLPSSLQGLFHPPNIDAAAAKRMVAIGSPALMSSELWLDFARFLEMGKPADENGVPYLQHLPASVVPVLLLSGSKDAMAPPASVFGAVRPQQDRGERKCITYGRDTGCREDYGHVDLLVGRNTETEVYPDILEWLGSRDSLCGNDPSYSPADAR